jgi:hypothetical protein
MKRFIAVAIAARCIMTLPVVFSAEVTGQVEADEAPHNVDALFPQELKASASHDIPGARGNPAWTDEDAGRLFATIVGARISEPERVAGLLHDLRVESTGHLGRLDPEEWSEMMAEMRSGGVALGSRNKLRLLVEARARAVGASSVGSRRVQADESSSTGRQDDSTSTATKQAREQESTNENEGTIFGVSGDSAPHVPLRCLV